MLKFVLIEKENNSAEIRLFNVETHKDLVCDGEKCLGGGFWKFDDDKKQIVMWDKSYDFGYPEFKGRKIVCYDDDWEDFEFYYVYDLFMPRDEWNNVHVNKYVIYRMHSHIETDGRTMSYEFLAFHTRPQRDLFLKENEDLVKDYLMIS